MQSTSQPQPITQFAGPKPEGDYNRVENGRYAEHPASTVSALIVTLFVTVGALAACQVGLTAAQVVRSQGLIRIGAGPGRYSWGWFNRLCLMLFTACWTLLFALVHWMLSLYATTIFLIVTLIFWVVSCVLWQIVYNLTPDKCDGTGALSDCRRQVGIDVLGWTILGWVTLLLVSLVFYWIRDRRGIGFHKRGCRTTYLDML